MNEQHSAGSTDSRSECSHTPAPWSYDQDLRDLEVGGDHVQTSEALKVCALDGEQEICEVFGRDAKNSTSYYWKYTEQAKANARLIAAAPDLLALAKKLAGECAECGGVGYQLVDTGMPVDSQVDCADCYDIRAVIAKAEGRS